MSSCLETREMPKGYRVRIHPDDCMDECPYEELTHTVFHQNDAMLCSIDIGRHGKLGFTPMEFFGEKGVDDGLWFKELKPRGWKLYKIYAYIHGNIAFSISSSGQFSDQFDSGVAGYIAFNPPHWGENLDVIAKSVVESLGMWWNGEVYLIDLEDSKGRIVDSCGGFIGYESVEGHIKETYTEKYFEFIEKCQIEKDKTDFYNLVGLVE